MVWCIGRVAKIRHRIPHHRSGLECQGKHDGTYNTPILIHDRKGIPTSEYKPAGSTAAAAGAPAPPPPPGPPPPPPPPASTASVTSGGGVAAVFAEINRGSEVTKGLRKVDKSEMTHKNPSLRAGGPVPSTTCKNFSLHVYCLDL